MDGVYGMSMLSMTDPQIAQVNRALCEQVDGKTGQIHAVKGACWRRRAFVPHARHTLYLVKLRFSSSTYFTLATESLRHNG